MKLIEHLLPTILFFSQGNKTTRLEICHDRRDWRSCKIFSSCANFFPEKNAFFAKFTQKYEIHSFIWWVYKKNSPKLFRLYIFISISIKKRTNVIFIEICAISLLPKSVAIYAVLVCKIFCPKIQSCNFFDKFHVCTFHQICICSCQCEFVYLLRFFFSFETFKGNTKKTRSSWLNCALRDDEAVYWVSKGLR